MEKKKYFNLYKDCLIVGGAIKSLLMDLTRQDVFEFPSYFYDILKNLEHRHYYEVISENKDAESEIKKFIEYLVDNEFGHFLTEIEKFPSVDENFTDYLLIRNSIIEIDDYSKSDVLLANFIELDQLGCKHLELRIYNNFDVSNLSKLFKDINFQNLNSVNIILKYNCLLNEEFYLSILESTPIVSNIFIHSAENQKIISKTLGYGDIGNRQLIYTKQIISSNKDCGNIKLEAFLKMGIGDILLNKNCNSCLYKKVAIDTQGNIKNCPSLEKTFGNIRDTSIRSIVATEEFLFVGGIKKDEIKICQDCQYRYLCFDCRAFIENQDDIYSKPLKCGYNPYTDSWSEWKLSVKNRNVIKKYNF